MSLFLFGLGGGGSGSTTIRNIIKGNQLTANLKKDSAIENNLIKSDSESITINNSQNITNDLNVISNKDIIINKQSENNSLTINT